MAKYTVTNLRFAEGTYRELQYQASRRRTTVASLVREAVDRYLGRSEDAPSLAFGADPAHVAACGVAVVEASLAEGLLPVAKHFPGHGDTDVDSHSGLPVINHSQTEWNAIDAPSFQAAIDAGIEVVMTAHIAVPALDPTGTPATLSHPILTDVLRTQMGFDGVVITDVDPNSDAADKGLKAGDVILQVAGETVSEPRDVSKGIKKAMDKAGDKDKVNILVQVKTGDQTRFVALSLKKAKV